MVRNRATLWRNLLIALYVLACALPVGEIPGGFLATLLPFFAGVLLYPALAVLWSANPLFWLGLGALGRGEFRRATRLGAAATLVALLPLYFLAEPLAREPHRLLEFSGYLVWLACMIGLAVVGLVGWSPAPLRTRRFRLSTLMLAVAAVALALALFPAFVRLVRAAMEVHVPLGAHFARAGFVILGV